MSFTTKEQTYNTYGEPSGKKVTCTVCGKEWFESNRNDGWNEQRSCGNVALIQEWDGQKDLVHFTQIDNTLVKIQYQDGTIHLVDIKYFNTLLVHIYR